MGTQGIELREGFMDGGELGSREREVEATGASSDSDFG